MSAAFKYLFVAAVLMLLGGLWYASAISETPKPERIASVPPVPAGAQVITLGAGCFWHAQAVFKQIPGVLSITVGYMGGTTKNPTPETVSRGNTGHTEVSRIVFDPTRTSLEKILRVFWTMHHPAQSNSITGRSVIFYSTAEQCQIAQKSKLAAGHLFPQPIVTQILPAQAFYAAEESHQDYLAKSQRQCGIADIP